MNQYGRMIGPAWSPIFLGLFLLLLTTGCGQDFDPGMEGEIGPAGENFSTPIPGLIGREKLVLTPGELTAEVVVDGGSPTALDVDLDNKKVSGTIEDLSEGDHTFVVNYYINNVLVASGEQTAFIQAGTNTTVAIPSIRYPDSDGDGFTNLAELESGTDPLLASSRPPSEFPRFSKNYVLFDVAGLSFLTGHAESENYVLTSGL